MKIGDIVRLKGRKTTAMIMGRVKGVKGGVILGKKLSGFNRWNAQDLERVSEGKTDASSADK